MKKVDHHAHSLLISKTCPYFMKFCSRIRQLSQFLIEHLVIIQLVLSLYKEKLTFFVNILLFLFLFSFSLLPIAM